MVCNKGKHVNPFFYHLLSRWLIPGKCIEVPLHFAMDYEKCTICEMVLSFQNQGDLACARHHFSFLEREILLGVKSPYHATKILEMKGLNLDEKTTMIQERLATFVDRFPKMFDYDLFEEMQQFLITSKEEFKAIRRTKELSRIIFTLYFFRKQLEKETTVAPQHRHLRLKFRPMLLHTSFGLKEILSIYVGLNFLKGHELFEERHFLSSLSHVMPGVQSIPSSYYVSEADDAIQTFYIEVEKDTQYSFTEEEVTKLKTHLGKEILSRVEQLVPPVFMPRNEEEVMRNIVLLASQLRYLRDIPQMIISFDEQTDSELCFTVILVRLIGPDSVPIKELFRGGALEKNLSIERIKMVGRLRRKHPKEATVMRVCLPAEKFLREDFSVDLLSARIQLVSEIEQALGEVRDYNGGMISKQAENYQLLKKVLGKEAEKHALLLQNFFHSIYPAVFSTTLDPIQLKTLFSMLLEAMESPEMTRLQSKKGKGGLFIMIKVHDFSLRQKIFSQIEHLNLPSNELCSVHMQIFDAFYLGFLHLHQSPQKQEELMDAVSSLTFAANPSYL